MNDDALIYRTAELFLQENGSLNVQQISDKLREEFPRATVNRQSIYALLSRARRNRVFVLTPPVEIDLEQRLRQKFGSDILRGEEDGIKGVTVIDCEAPESSNEAAATGAAQLILKLIRKLTKTGRTPVGLGLGPGRAALDVASILGQLIRSDSAIEKLNLVAISSGCLARRPQFSSTGFINLFPQSKLEQSVGLFTQPLVLTRDFERLRSEPQVEEAFQAKGLIDIICTSMGDMEDPHSLFPQIMKAPMPGKRHPPKWLKGCIGDVQFRPFSEKGPIQEGKDDYRMVTLFELDELVTMARQKDKYVVLIARQCTACVQEQRKHRTHAKALRALLTKDTRLFSHLVIDSRTAAELLNL